MESVDTAEGQEVIGDDRSELPVERPPRVLKLGATARDLWALAPDAVHLNHGSYGACPKIVQHAQDHIRRRIEAAPDQYFAARVMPDSGESDVRKAAATLAQFIGCGADRVAMVENATVGIEAVLRSIPLRRGDLVLITDHQYAAVRLAVQRRCRETGARPLVIRLPIPLKHGQVHDRIEAAVRRERPALAILDHITSPTAITLPLRSLVYLLRDYGVPVLADGAHAIGQVALDLPSIRPDWYVANAHKWLYAPRGTAVLYAAPRAACVPQPLVTSHYVRRGFPAAFDYLGTRDYSAWAAAPAALQFWKRMAAAGLDAHCGTIIEEGSTMLERIGLEPVAPLIHSAFMRSFILPQREAARPEDAAALKRQLWEDARIQVYARVHDDKLLLRISAQAYVELDDIAALAHELERRGWPGR